MLSTARESFDQKKAFIQRVCLLAINLDEAALNKLVADGVFLFPQVGLDDPILILAQQNEHEAVDLLLDKYHGNINRAARGYAIAGNEEKCKEMLARGASVDMVVLGAGSGGQAELASIYAANITNKKILEFRLVQGSSLRGSGITLPPNKSALQSMPSS